MVKFIKIVLLAFYVAYSLFYLLEIIFYCGSQF